MTTRSFALLLAAGSALPLAVLSHGCGRREKTRQENAPAARQAPKDLTCCGKHFHSKRELVEHEVQHHGKLGCPSCGTLFDSKKEYVQHMVQHHGKLGCPSCGILFDSKKEYQEHMKKHHHR